MRSRTSPPAGTAIVAVGAAVDRAHRAERAGAAGAVGGHEGQPGAVRREPPVLAERARCRRRTAAVSSPSTMSTPARPRPSLAAVAMRDGRRRCRCRAARTRRRSSRPADRRLREVGHAVLGVRHAHAVPVDRGVLGQRVVERRAGSRSPSAHPQDRQDAARRIGPERASFGPPAPRRRAGPLARRRSRQACRRPPRGRRAGFGGRGCRRGQQPGATGGREAGRRRAP